MFSQDQRPCRLDYQIVCDSLWHTRSGKVAGWVGDIPVEIKIVVDPDLRWFLNEKDCPEIAGCVDLDTELQSINEPSADSPAESVGGRRGGSKSSLAPFSQFQT